MSPQTIEMHFAEIMRLSEELDHLAQSLKLLAEQEMMQMIRENRACWVSKCADILGEKEGKISGSLCAEAERLLKTATEMKDRAQKMYLSEMMNIRLAATRIYR